MTYLFICQTVIVKLCIICVFRIASSIHFVGCDFQVSDIDPYNKIIIDQTMPFQLRPMIVLWHFRHRYLECHCPLW